MGKKNIGATLALYPSPLIVVGAMVEGKPTWTLVAHAGIMAHSHLMVSLVQAHYINKGIRENKKLSVNVVDASWLEAADRMGTISGNKTDKSEAFDMISKDKIACRNRQKFKVRLRGFVFCFAVNSAISDSDDGLFDLIVVLFAQKICNALFLVIVQVVIKHGRADAKR